LAPDPKRLGSCGTAPVLCLHDAISRSRPINMPAMRIAASGPGMI
jgi:hypothetical protein